jgi:hypothetical protein
MKISVNLGTYSSPRERYGLAWALPLALFGILGLLLIGRSILANLGEYHRVQSRLDAEAQEEKVLDANEAALRKELDQPGQKAMFQKAHFVNGLIAQKQFSLTQMTERVSKLMPATVRLVSLRVTRPKADISVRFSVVGRDEAGLEKFVENLEDANDFTDLSVANQAQPTDKSLVGMMQLVCTARYLGEGAK